MSDSEKLSFTNILGLGFMLCAFFLGAGNIIFPASAGFQSGEYVFSSMIGFLITAVGLPLIGVIAVAISGGSLEQMTRHLPRGSGTIATIILFTVIGPAFAMPRTSLVAWEIAVQPLLPAHFLETHTSALSFIDSSTQYYQLLTTVVFFIIAAAFAIFRTSLIDTIGKLLTPILFILLILLAVSVILFPWGTPQAPNGDYATHPFSKGFLEGYNTMDAFASLMFGGLIVNLLRRKGVVSGRLTCKYLIIAGIIAAIGLSVTYISLFWLGATTPHTSSNASAQGTQILTEYVQFLYGNSGSYILAGVVSLACLTTAIGLLSSCSDYFNRLTGRRLGYASWVIIFALLSIWVANVGLSTLISASIPALYALYPMVIVIVLLAFLDKFMNRRRFVYRSIMGVSLIMGILAALKKIELAGESLLSKIMDITLLPLHHVDMEWIVPVSITALIVLFVEMFYPKKMSEKQPIER